MDVEHADIVEKQLDALIQRRARKGVVDPDEDLNPEAKQRRAQEVIDRHGPQKVKAYQDAREKVHVCTVSALLRGTCPARARRPSGEASTPRRRG